MTKLENLYEQIEALFQFETNGVLDKKWAQRFAFVNEAGPELNMYDIIENFGELEVIIEKPIFMGHYEDSDILEFVDECYLEISSMGRVSILQQIVKAKIAENGCIELTFPDEKSSCDIIFDNKEDYNEYISIFS